MFSRTIYTSENRFTGKFMQEILPEDVYERDSMKIKHEKKRESNRYRQVRQGKRR